MRHSYAKGHENKFSLTLENRYIAHNIRLGNQTWGIAKLTVYIQNTIFIQFK